MILRRSRLVYRLGLRLLSQFPPQTDRMTSELQHDWDLSVNALELDEGPVYFCSDKVLSHPTTRDVVELHKETLSDTLNRAFPSSVSFAFTAYNPGDVSQSDVKNAIDYDKLEKELEKRKLSGNIIKKCYGFIPTDSSHFERGFHLFASDEAEIANNTRKFVNDICVEFGQAGYFEYSFRGGCVYQDLVSVPSQKVEAVSSLVRVDPPPFHPVFARPNYHSVFHSFAKLQQILAEMKVLGLDGVKELLAVAAQNSIPLGGGGELSLPKAKGPVIVVEGLDGAGKTTLCRTLSESMNATLLGTPPICLQDLRPTFDAYPPLVRRAFYTLGNYIAAQEMARASQSGPVVVDRFWHSSAAYAIATEVGCGGVSAVPPEGHEVYTWPLDLLKPEVAVLLVLTPEERRRRLLGRGGQLTKEEVTLDRSTFFQERLLECYKRMSGPSLNIVDASGSPDEVLQKVMEIVRLKLPELKI